MGNARARGSYEERKAHPRGKRRSGPFVLADISVTFPLKGFLPAVLSYVRAAKPSRHWTKRRAHGVRGLRTVDRRRGWTKRDRMRRRAA